jgi:uncharacterized FlaG/YvyC family protein
MSDPVQMPPSHAVVPPVAPVRAAPPVEPATKPQADNRDSNDRREGERQQNQAANLPADRRLTISRDSNLHSFVYRSIESGSGEVVWQWPAEEMLRRAQSLRAVEAKMREEGGAHDVDEKA